MPPPESRTPRPATTAAGTATLYLWGSLAAFGVFLMAVPGREAAARTWLWVGVVLVVIAVPGLVLAARARHRYLRREQSS